MAERSCRLKMTEQSIRNFINFHYQPLSASQIITRLIAVWILSIACCLLGSDRYLWAIGVLIPNLLLMGIILYILRIGIREKTSKFLWDGLTYMYMSVILNFTAYHILTWESGYDLALLFLLILFLLLSLVSAGILVFHNIRDDKYNEQEQTTGKSVFPYLLSLAGFLFVKYHLDVAGNRMGIQIVAMTLLIISVFLGLGWTNLIRLVLNRKLKTGDNSLS